MALKLYDSVAIDLKLKLKNSLGYKSYVCRSYMGKTGRGPFWPLIQSRPKLYFSSCVWYQKRYTFYPNGCISRRYITYHQWSSIKPVKWRYRNIININDVVSYKYVFYRDNVRVTIAKYEFAIVTER